MDSYKIVIKKSAEKEIVELPQAKLGIAKLKEVYRLPLADRKRVVNKILRLKSSPRPKDCYKLEDNVFYRLRQGNYRIVYEVYDEERLVRIIKVGHRREVYR